MIKYYSLKNLKIKQIATAKHNLSNLGKSPERALQDILSKC